MVAAKTFLMLDAVLAVFHLNSRIKDFVLKVLTSRMSVSRNAKNAVWTHKYAM